MLKCWMSFWSPKVGHRANLSFQRLPKGFKLLQSNGMITPPELQLTGIELLNDSTLVACIIPLATDAVGVKLEVATTMGAVSCFFRDEFELPPSVKSFGVRAFLKMEMN